MSKKMKNIDGLALAALLFGASLLTRKAVARTWFGITNEPPPPEKSNADVDVVEAVTWAVASGVTVGLVRFALRRLSYRGSPLD